MIIKGYGGTVIFNDGREEMIHQWRKYDDNFVWFTTSIDSYIAELREEGWRYFVFNPWTNHYLDTDAIKEVTFEGETH